MAFRQAHYILNDFSTPSIRSNHNSVLSRENGSINNITPNGVKYVHIFFSHTQKTLLTFRALECLFVFLCLGYAVKQREAVRATWTPVTPLTKVRGVALQLWPTAPPHALSLQRKAPQRPHPNHKRNTKCHCITPNTSPARRQQRPVLRRWTKNMKT